MHTAGKINFQSQKKFVSNFIKKHQQQATQQTAIKANLWGRPNGDPNAFLYDRSFSDFLRLPENAWKPQVSFMQ